MIPGPNGISGKNFWFIRGFAPYALLILACLLLYAQTFDSGFSPMDETWIILAEKGNLSHLSNLPHLFTLSTLGVYYRPVLSVSLMLDYVMGNGSTFNFHLTNVLLHITCCIILFRFLMRIGLENTTAFVCALIFAVHPVNVHAVAWIPGRNDMLLTLFSLSSCLFLTRYLKENKTHFIVLHFIFFALCLLTKESAIVLPAIFLLLYFLITGKKPKLQLLVLISVWMLTGAAWFFIRRQIAGSIAITNDEAGALLPRFFSSLIMHTGKALLPVEQSVFPRPADTSLWPFAAAIIFLAVTAFLSGIKNKKLAFFGLFWFFILLILPAWYGSIDESGEQYEHRDYTPLAGMLIFISQVNFTVNDRVKKILVFLLITAFSLKTFFRVPVYHNAFTYAQAGVEEAPEFAFFHDALGTEYMSRGNLVLAVESYTKCLALDSGNGDFYTHRGAAYLEMKNYSSAIADYNKALQHDPALKQTYMEKGIAEFYLGKIEDAKADIQKGKNLGANVPVDLPEELKENGK